jgi:hypothetical protein
MFGKVNAVVRVASIGLIKTTYILGRNARKRSVGGLNRLKPTGHVLHQQFNLLKPTGYVMHQQLNLLKPTG